MDNKARTMATDNSGSKSGYFDNLDEFPERVCMPRSQCVLDRVTDVMMKYCDQRPVGEERVYLVYASTSMDITGGS